MVGDWISAYMRPVPCVPCDAPIPSFPDIIEVYFCEGKKGVTFDYEEIWDKFRTLVPSEFKMIDSLTNEEMFAQTLMFALLNHGSSNVQAIGESVMAEKSFVFMKLTDNK
eukprot:GHVU01157553.1.p1 GENE.GHVU01157553.1~~GHVU01157553.1.p1  ORF type:complete len:110 (+),score=7.70 GHVU01157553.1:91-420(+)